MTFRSPRELWSRISWLRKRHQLDADLDAELAHHLELRATKNAARGMDPEEAHYAARRQFGNVTSMREKSRAVWTFPSFESWWFDVRYGFRLLRKNAGPTAIALLTLALGIGANTAVFSVIKPVLLRSLPYRQPEQLVSLAQGDSRTTRPTNVSFGEVEDWKPRAKSFSEIVLYRGWTPASTGNGKPDIVHALRVTQNFFETLGVSTYLGREFLPEEDRPERWRVVVLSYPYWVRHFGANREAVGQTILLDQKPFLIVGVLPQTFESLSFTDAGSPPDLWAPLGYDQSLPMACRTCQHLQAFARVKPGFNLASASAEMNTISAQLAREFPNDYPADAKVTILPLRESWYGKISNPLRLLFAATVVLLLIACANVANLLLAQSAKKRREVALRSVLGATRARIIRQSLTESMALSLLGGIAGVLLASWGTSFLLRWAPDAVPRLPSARLDFSVLIFNLIVTMLTGILIGLLPALQSLQADQAEAMQQTSRTVRGFSRSRVRNVLVASQVCLAFLLTVASGLLLKSFIRAWTVDPGLQLQNLYEVNFSFVGHKYDDDKVVQRVHAEVVDRVQHIPGIESVALVSTPPLAGNFGGYDQAGFHIQDRHVPDPEVPSVDRYIVSSDYFHTLGMPILRGRSFAQTDTSTSEHVAVISDMAARQIFSGEDPIGRRIQLGGRHEDRPWATIVGIVGNIHQYGLDSPVTPQAYLLDAQEPFNYAAVLLVRSNIRFESLNRAIEEQIWSIDKDAVVFNPAWMTEILAHSLAARRFTMTLLTGFGSLALILAAVGTYGVMSYIVAQRTDEIGVRMALGAQGRQILRLITAHGMLRAGFGLIVGLLISLALTRLLSSELFAVSPFDPVTFIAVLCLLGIVALAACYFPARRAARVDPMAALRHG